MWYKDMTGLIGNTPLVQLNKVTKDVMPTVLVKLECFNPGGSIKDRTAYNMISEAEKMGLLVPGGTIVETTSGNTGIGVAWQSVIKGYKAVIIAGENISSQKESIIKALGAKVIKCKTYEEQFELAGQIVKDTPGSFFINQMDNQDNVGAHYKTTGPEIWEQTDGEVDYVIAGLGSGGTISGVSQYLKERKNDVQMVGVEPVGSVYNDYHRYGKVGETSTYNIEGIGNIMVQKSMHINRIDRIVQVSDEAAYEMSRKLLREEGIFVGASSGAIVCAALQIAVDVSPGKIIVAVLPDVGYTYTQLCFEG